MVVDESEEGEDVPFDDGDCEEVEAVDGEDVAAVDSDDTKANDKPAEGEAAVAGGADMEAVEMEGDEWEERLVEAATIDDAAATFGTSCSAAS